MLLKGYKLIYSNKLIIYHSHIFDIPYLYKRFYWFIYYNLMDNLNPEHTTALKRFKKLIKNYGYKYYLFVNKIYTKSLMKKFFEERNYSVDEELIDYYLYVKYLAVYNAFKDFSVYKDKHPENYVTLNIPEDVKNIENKVKKRGLNFDGDFKVR